MTEARKNSFPEKYPTPRKHLTDGVFTVNLNEYSNIFIQFSITHLIYIIFIHMKLDSVLSNMLYIITPFLKSVTSEWLMLPHSLTS